MHHLAKAYHDNSLREEGIYTSVPSSEPDFKEHSEDVRPIIDMVALEYSSRFYDVLNELKNLHDQKKQDYGTTTDPFANIRASQEFGVAPWLSSVLRANDKMARLKSFVLNGKLVNESVEDSLKDMAVYCIIALLLWRESCEKNTAEP